MDRIRLLSAGLFIGTSLYFSAWGKWVQLRLGRIGYSFYLETPADYLALLLLFCCLGTFAASLVYPACEAATLWAWRQFFSGPATETPRVVAGPGVAPPAPGGA